MLFVFNRPDKYEFTMRGMEFPLDFIWINGDKVVDLTPDISPPAPGAVSINITPGSPADYVLEVNAGTINKLGINIGETVIIRKSWLNPL